MGLPDVTVRLQALDGTWETCGADRMIGVVPESEQHSDNEWGPDKASFDLKRPVFAIWPDLGAFTPVEIEIGGVIVWDGRIGETPLQAGAEQTINVQCEGWQYHLDDDVYARCYVHAKLTDWKDTRSLPGAALTRFVAAPQVGSTQGAITLGWANGDPAATNDCVGVTLDLGQYSTATRIVVTLGTTGVTDPNIKLYARGANHEDATTVPVSDAIATLEVKGQAGTIHAGTFSEPARYVHLFLIYLGVGGTYAADEIVQITGVQVFTDTTFESGNASILKASTIIPDALTRSTLLLSSDTSQVGATSFNIPDFVVSKLSTPREVIEAANAYHNWIAKLLPGRRFSFQARPTAATLEIGAWSGADLSDTSANSGAEIYSRAVVEATGPEGSPLTTERTAAQQPGATPTAIASPAPDNPSFAVNLEHWTAEIGSITRDTAVFDTAPASLQLKPAGGPSFFGRAIGTFTGTFKKGTLYLLTFTIKGKLNAPGANAAFGEPSSANKGNTDLSGIGSEAGFTPVTVAWSPTKDTVGASLFVAGKSTVPVWIDSLALTVIQPTLVDRRGFQRTKVIQTSSAITATEGQQLADTFLQGHTTTPFKGSANVYPGGIRTVLGGQPVHPSQLGLHTQELLRLGQAIDPDTGGVGRDGTIAEVAYTHADQKAAVTLDDKRGNFDALLARLAVVQTVGS